MVKQLVFDQTWPNLYKIPQNIKENATSLKNIQRKSKGVYFSYANYPLKICKLANNFHWRLTAQTQAF
jgi:hypothetical protein